MGSGMALSQPHTFTSDSPDLLWKSHAASSKELQEEISDLELPQNQSLKSVCSSGKFG